MVDPSARSPSFHELSLQCMLECEQIASSTDSPGQITRLYLSRAIGSVHEHLTRRMTSLGMAVRTDDAGNLIGVRPAATGSALKLLLGSHLDTVPNGGKYDGALGVAIALAVVQAFDGHPLPFAIEVHGFSEEEGVRFAKPFLGSHAIAGTFDSQWLQRLDATGQTMGAAIEAFGLNPKRICDAAYPPETVIGFVETHIEQGPLLASVDRPVGLVESIAGQSRLLVRFQGAAGHAGTVPMGMRRDALITGAKWIVAVNQLAESFEDLRATVGHVDVRPNVRNVIPGSVVLSIDVRHADDSTRQSAVDRFLQTAQQFADDDNLEFSVVDHQSQPAAHMDQALTEQLSTAMIDCGVEAFAMTSGAGHDAAIMAHRFPTALMFVRQALGISHHPDEDVEASDVAVAIHVLTQLIQRLADQHRNQQ